MPLVSKYIYFAANNISSHILYKKSFIIGETEDLIERQRQYNVISKGMPTPSTGDIVSMTGERNLIFPFVDAFKFTRQCNANTKNTHDAIIHDILKHERPFTDMVYNLKDKKLMNTKESFVFYATNDYLNDILNIKNFLIENLSEFHSYSIIEYKYTF